VAIGHSCAGREAVSAVLVVQPARAAEQQDAMGGVIHVSASALTERGGIGKSCI